MHPYTYKISLTISHPSLDPQVFSDELQLKSEKSHKVGDRRSTPKGDVLEGCYKTSYWRAEFVPPDDSDLAGYLERLAADLSQHRAFFMHIRNTGGDIEFFIGLFAEGVNIGVTLDHDLLLELGGLGIDLGLDIYNYPDDAVQNV